LLDEFPLLPTDHACRSLVGGHRDAMSAAQVRKRTCQRSLFTYSSERLPRPTQGHFVVRATEEREPWADAMFAASSVPTRTKGATR
jgi:hypothetical protein